MIERKAQILGGLLMLLAAAPEAIPQTPRSGAPARQVASRKTVEPGNKGRSPATATPAAMPQLCFQAGVGWQRIVPEPPGAPATQGPRISIGLEAIHSASAAHAESIDARSSNAQQASAAGCAGDLTNKKTLGGAGEGRNILHGSQTLRSAGPTRPGTLTSLRGNLPYHAHGSAGLEPVGMTPSAMPSIPTDFASEAESDTASEQFGVRTFHAYTSSIKLRRLIRNAPDFRTRLQLQQLQNSPHSHKAGAATKPGAAQAKRLHGDRILTTGSRNLGVGP